MKLVVAIIRPDKYGTVQSGLTDLGLSQLTFSEVWGQGHEGGPSFIYRGRTFRDDRIKRLKVEVAVDDDTVDAVVEAIRISARTGAVGDGVILVTPLEGFTRIRTGQCVKAPQRRQEKIPFDRAHSGANNGRRWLPTDE
jgi:nitrogen regulatory protein PII